MGPDHRSFDVKITVGHHGDSPLAAALPYIHLGRSLVGSRISRPEHHAILILCGVLRLDFRDPPSVIRLAVHCCLHIICGFGNFDVHVLRVCLVSGALALHVVYMVRSTLLRGAKLENQTVLQ